MPMRAVPLLLVLAACVTTPPKPDATPAPPPTPAASADTQQKLDLERESREIVDAVSGLRGLTEKRKLDIRVLDEAAFAAALKKVLDEGIKPEDVREERARWFAFGLAPVEADPEGIARGVLDEQVAGFYDHHSKALYVRKTLPASAAAGGDDELRGVLAHEIEHALQDQHFGLDRMDAPADDDAKLAFQSAVEGEAMLVMIAYAADGQLDRQRATAVAGALEKMPVDALLRMSGKSDKLLEAPAIVRAELVMPYLDGLVLASRVYAAGGWPLLDRYLAKPPASTEQVLHPQKYFTGERPVPVPAPLPPAGHKSVSSGQLGELGVRVLLQGCGAQEAVAAAAGWGGDAWLVSAAPDGTLALQWRTVWDTAEDAQAFARAANRLTQCWQAQEGGPEKWRLAAGATVTADGAKAVVITRGPAVSGAAATLLKGLSALQAPRSEPPVGAVEEPAPAAPSGTVVDGRWIDPARGLSLEIPDGYFRLEDPTVDFAMRRRDGSPAMGMLNYVASKPEPKVREELLGGVAKGFEASSGGLSLVQLEDAATPDGGWVRGWKVDGAPLRLRSTIRPACGGRAFVVLTSMWTDAAGETQLARWVASAQAVEATGCPR